MPGVLCHDASYARRLMPGLEGSASYVCVCVCVWQGLEGSASYAMSGWVQEARRQVNE